MYYVLILCVLTIIYLCSKLIIVNRKRIEAELFIRTIESTKDFYYYVKTKPELEYRYLSPGIEQYFGKGSQIKNLKEPYEAYRELIHPDDLHIVDAKIGGTANYAEPLLVRLKTITGEYRWFEEYAVAIHENGQFVAVHGVYRDIHEKMMLQQALQYKAIHDQLTNVKNRTYFEEQLTKLNDEQNVACGIIICDLDNLKQVNDEKGHKTGDEYIQKSAALLIEGVAQDGEICRIGGDEFAILVRTTTARHVTSIIEKIEAQINDYNTTYPERSIQMSIGSSFTIRSVGEMDELFKRADDQMYAQKANRKTLKVR